MWSSILSIAGTAFKWLFYRKTRKDLHKNEEAKRDHSSRNEHEDMVERAGDTGNLDEIRRRASE
jgi:hypothetical protein